MTTMTDHDSSEVLRQEIIGEARRLSDEILACARQDAEALLGREGSQAIEARVKCLEEARSEGARRRDLILGAVFVETRRLHLARIEVLLEEVRMDAQGQFDSHDAFDHRESIINLASEAVRGMMGEEFIVRLAEKNRSLLGDALSDDIASRAGRPGTKITVSWDSLMMEDGPVVTDTTGNQVWDNRYSARLERLWPQMRRAIAGEMFPAGPEESEGGIT
ncbi:MAG: V-type ATP synthase subunit E [Syntrophales bacterium]|nr:V-type ATP synthase subunit E [Syntrophales bacterium]